MTLVCKDLVVEYAAAGYAVRPIDCLNVEVKDGELALLLGASGCGKTTLLSVLASICAPRKEVSSWAVERSATCTAER